MLKRTLAAAALILGVSTFPPLAQEAQADTAAINGLEMYYEVHGEGPPLVLIHGAYMTIPTNWDALIPTLAETHQVIAMELQGHGRTSDRDTPISYEGMADDVAALLDHLAIPDAAIFGYSMGGGVALQLAVRHPERVNRLVVASMPLTYAAYPDDFHAMIEGMTPDIFAGGPMEAAHLELGKTPEEFLTLFTKLRALDLEDFAWPEADFAALTMPTLLIFGDADVVGMDHIAEMHRIFGGHTNGDIRGLPKAQLLVLPGTTHIGVFFTPQSLEIVRQVVPTFLAQDLPQPPAPM
ncbi:MAG: alpha/beta fold hydrolase [Bauldia sp.]